MIPQTFIDDLLSRVDVADVVGRHVKLRKAGANLQGLCPFHSEKTPSFTVSPIKQFYHCFGCGAHGTAIGFLMEHGGLGYVDAIEELAQSVGLTVPHEPGTAKRLTVPEAPNLIELLTSAARYYQRRLKESPQAIDYLKRRGLSGVTAGKYGLGFAPDGWRNLEAAVPDYNDESLVRAGLVKHSGDNETRSGLDAGHSTALQSSVADQYLENKQDHNQDHYIQDQNQSASGDSGRRRKRYDRFRNRVMFPIRNPRGGIIGFGGRVMDSSEPKYLNS
ncbi:MAG: CHC2 zinc finger domain-containing protein, partial [Burkholderiaceae bacterium]